MPNLSHLLRQAVAHTASDWDGGLDLDELLHLLDVGAFRGKASTRNDHLANPLNREDDVFYTRPRATPFHGSEPVFGDFLTVEYCGHYPYAVLRDHDSENLLESAILGPAGITNIFTTYLMVFKNYTLCPYALTFSNRDGDRVRFDKQRQYEPPLYAKSEDFRDLRLQWIGT
mgnify:CR=1 FL=1|jgi:hypothetical protein